MKTKQKCWSVVARRAEIKLENENLKQVNECKYLESVITSGERSRKEIKFEIFQEKTFKERKELSCSKKLA